MLVRENAPLAPLTTLGLGGPAGRLVCAYDADEVVDAVRAEPSALVLGGGSNVVLPDEGVPGTVVRVCSRGLAARHQDGAVLVEAAAGESWDGLTAHCAEAGLTGIEALAGIPGLVGATPVQNVGAYGQEVAQVLESVRVYDRRDRQRRALPAGECGFGYRTSVFKADPDRWVVLSVVLRLEAGALSAPVRYAELARALDVGVGDRAPLEEVRAAVLRLRRGKGMVVDPADPDSRSAGSFFTNPLLSSDEAAALRTRAVGHPPLPEYVEPGGRVKVSAAWLIEQAGFPRGYGAGSVGISGKHSLALVHRGGGTSADLVALAREVRDGVQRVFGVTLVPEPVIVGDRL